MVKGTIMQALSLYASPEVNRPTDNPLWEKTQRTIDKSGMGPFLKKNI